ncbi:MAG: phosphopyruvate hydratase [Dehalococcoidia bacterium]
MSKISTVNAREILDSRGNPTVYAVVTLEDGTRAGASVPSGASTGEREALELRDGDKGRYRGKGVLTAVANANGPLQEAARGMDADDQQGVDNAMIEIAGGSKKERLGANAVLAISLASLHASAASRGVTLYEHIANLGGHDTPVELPVPMLNILNGGAHAAGSTDFQEFMIAPIGLPTFSEALRAGAEIYHQLGAFLHDQGHSTNVGFEGGYAPQGLTNRQALDFVTQAIEDAGYRPGEDVFVALDPAASEFYDTGASQYDLKRDGRRLSSAEMVREYIQLSSDYPIYSIEDGMAENDWEGWAEFTRNGGDRLQLVGDDLFVTQAEYLERGIAEKAGNAILIKLNQVGTVSETLDTIRIAKQAGFGVVVSHRSGETEDTTIADLAVGTSAGQIKTGAPARSERVAKYNRLLHIEQALGDRAVYAGGRVRR